MSAFISKTGIEGSQTFYIGATLWLSKSSIAFKPSEPEYWALKAVNHISITISDITCALYFNKNKLLKVIDHISKVIL